eukprot:TRINITY_DN2055_c0_g1::TRINITY_DN2055_c0_g1_i1::g.21836::m.21836 TRINITY_DN2055_c0_g1::TRINITY_DN2055_c0_g1_i1::g.21836  ORF type:complete len:438 (-),score=56.40,sp/Q07262/1A1C_TOBAC/33.65/4e-78,Aminotran_1_2/PF00155.16/7.5e-57,Beta_elim_lyase/PF01212.16/5.9e-06 TRINITY_DN2055_c0_g1_i1:23-1336(-)
MQSTHDFPLSRRGMLAQRPIASYFTAASRAQQDPYHPETNPEGYLSFCIAENRLVFPLLKEKLQHCRDIPSTIVSYPSMLGVTSFRKVLAKFLERQVFDISVDPDHLCVATGCGAVIHLLFHCITDKGDAVIIPTPQYPAFDNDLQVMDELNIIRAPTAAPDYSLTVEILQEAYERGVSQGQNVKAVLLCNPHNPLGRIYSRETLRDILHWCNAKRIHLVCDEIYAKSVFYTPEAFPEGSPESTIPCEFVSLAKVCEEEGMLKPDGRLPDNVHIIWGFSKDFAMNGFRVGCVYTGNAHVVKSWENLGYFFMVSTDTQFALQRMLEDEEFVDRYLAAAQAALRNNYLTATRACKDAGIPYNPCVSAQFLWIDLRQYLREHTFEAELELFSDLVTKCRIVLSPGQDCKSIVPGFFRLCFAAESPQALQVAIHRLTCLRM